MQFFKKDKAFTIVELVVVIVVIGILATITMVSYSGVTRRATVSVIKGDLSSNVTLLKIYEAKYGSFPTELDSSNCPVLPNINNNYCLKSSNGNAITYASAGQSFLLTVSNAAVDASYDINESGTISATPPAKPSYVYTWGGDDYDYGYSVISLSDGGYVLVGQTYSFGAGDGGVFISRFSDTGALIWNKIWDGVGQDIAYSVAQVNDGGLVVVGQSDSFGTSNGDAVVTKFDINGNLIWSKMWGLSGEYYGDVGSSIVKTSDGGFAIAGWTTRFEDYQLDAFVAKFAADGSLSWDKTWSLASYDMDFAHSVAQLNDGSIVIVGESFDGFTDTSAFIVKFAIDGSFLWNKTWGGSNKDIAYSIVKVSDGGFVVAGQTDSFNSGKEKAFIAKFTSAGGLAWNKTWGGTGNDSGRSVIQAADGGFVMAGDTTIRAGSPDMFIAKFSDTGTLSWSSAVGGENAQEFGESITQVTDGGYVVIGHTNSFGGAGETFIAKYNSIGGIPSCPSVKCSSVTATIGVPAASVLTPSATTLDTPATVTPVSITVSTPSVNYIKLY